MSFGLDSAEQTNTLLIFLLSLGVYINIAVRHFLSFTPAKVSPEFYCGELKGWVKGNTSKFEVVGRRWTCMVASSCGKCGLLRGFTVPMTRSHHLHPG